MCLVHLPWFSPSWWEQFSRRSYEPLALILTKLSSLWWAMAIRLKEILWRSVVCGMPVVSVIRCDVSCTFAMVEPFMMRTVFTTVLWALGFDSYQTQLTLTGKCFLIFLACHEIRRNKQTETAHFWIQCTFDLLHPESPWGVYYGLLVLGACKYSCQLRLWPCYFPSTLHFVNAGWYRSMELCC